MKAVRWILGRLILFFDWLFRPKGRQRDPDQQAAVDAQTASLLLYQYAACPFCVKVRRAMKRQSLKIAVRDAKQDPGRQELLAGGGELKVPCLRIEEGEGKVRWLYESSDIVRYLDDRFAA